IGSERIEIAFREKPFSVLFKWKEGWRLAEKTLYVEGENEEMLLVRPSGKLARAVAGDLVIRDPEGKDAKASGRYSLKEFGMNKGILRTLASWKDAKPRDAFHVEYLCESEVTEAADRL